jgi:hypothetical protein
MNAFLTGSRAYGTPHEKSDIDLVVMMDESELDRLLNVACDSSNSEAIEQYNSETACLRFGNLNLLIVTRREDYDAWWEGTTELTARSPVTRDEAVAVFQAKREANKAKRAAEGENVTLEIEEVAF